MLLLFLSQKTIYHRNSIGFPTLHTHTLTLLLWSWQGDLGHSGVPIPDSGEHFVSCCPPGVHLRLSLALGPQKGSRQCLVAGWMLSSMNL